MYWLLQAVAYRTVSAQRGHGVTPVPSTLERRTFLILCFVKTVSIRIREARCPTARDKDSCNRASRLVASITPSHGSAGHHEPHPHPAPQDTSESTIADGRAPHAPITAFSFTVSNTGWGIGRGHGRGAPVGKRRGRRGEHLHAGVGDWSGGHSARSAHIRHRMRHAAHHEVEV